MDDRDLVDVDRQAAAARDDWWRARQEVELAKQRLSEITRAGTAAYGSRRADATHLGVSEATLRHHEGVGAVGRGKRRRAS